MREQRVERLERLVAERKLDALVVTGLVGVRYLTGFTGTSGLCVVGTGIRTFFTDFRYAEQAKTQIEDFHILQGERDLLGSAARHLLEHGAERVGFEDHLLAVRAYDRLQKELGESVELERAGGLVESLRAIKGEAELEAIGAAAAIADEMYTRLAEQGVSGRTEREIALDLEEQMRRRGAEGPSFPTIVASGAQSALPHAVPRDEPVRPGTLMIVDMGSRHGGYCSDCTRTFAVGKPSDEARDVHDLVLRAQSAALEGVRAGADCAAVDGIARDILTEAGYGQEFGHGLGHGVGLEVHEEPRLARTAEGQLAVGNVVTVEPGVYLTGRLGVRIEDLVVVSDATPKVLTTFTKELVELDV